MNSLFIQKIAKICHEANRAYCESFKDYSQPSWEDSPEWQKASALNGIQYVIDNPDTKPQSMHDNWMRMKIADGWTYGKEKNVEMKTHPCIIPYEQLPATQQAKDYIFLAIVKTMVSLNDGEI